LWDNPRSDRASVPTVLQLIGSLDCRGIIERDFGPYPGDVARNMRRLDRTIHVAELVKRSRFHRALRAFRDEKVAHSLDFAVRAIPSVALKYGYERRLLRASIAVVSNLNNAIRNSSFMFDDAVDQSKRNAKALWAACNFEISE
jgi:hypothetical protein